VTALRALTEGDTASARQIAATFPSPDSLRNPTIRFGVGGMRSVARAEVLAAIGMPEQAAETLEATGVERINQSGIAEPGYAIWVRSWLARARLWAQVGDRARAVTAYQTFLRLWASADGAAAEEVRQARVELGRLTDAPPP
jgi:soluble lytic murein transglycosylase-like protein